jgi:hypothetical protein
MVSAFGLCQKQGAKQILTYFSRVGAKLAASIVVQSKKFYRREKTSPYKTG